MVQAIGSMDGKEPTRAQINLVEKRLLRTVDALVVVLGGRDTRQTEDAARAAGVPVVHLGEAEAAELYLQGVSLTGRISRREQAKADDRSPWPHPAAVVRAWAEGIGDLLGSRSVDFGGLGRSGGGQRESVLVERSVKLASASAIMNEAMASSTWPKSGVAIVVAIYKWDAPYQKAAEAAGFRWAAAAQKVHRAVLVEVQDAMARVAAARSTEGRS